MPIEIKELHIKINVEEGANKGNSQNSEGSNKNKSDLISACVEQVMEILNRRKER